MGNTLSPSCLQSGSKQCLVKVVFWEGHTRILTGKHLAGELMFQFPDMLICHANSFYIGHPIPSLSIDDELMPGETYFALPIDRFACHILSAASLAALASSPRREPMNFGDRPFEYLKGSNGRVLIKVSPDFIARILIKVEDKGCSGNPSWGLCSTPELQKHYAQLVGPKSQSWSPQLETIKECKPNRSSPCGISVWI